MQHTTLNDPGSALFANLENMTEEQIHEAIGKLRSSRISDIERTKKAHARKEIEARSPRPRRPKGDRVSAIRVALIKGGFPAETIAKLTDDKILQLAQKVMEE